MLVCEEPNLCHRFSSPSLSMTAESSRIRKADESELGSQPSRRVSRRKIASPRTLTRGESEVVASNMHHARCGFDCPEEETVPTMTRLGGGQRQSFGREGLMAVYGSEPQAMPGLRGTSPEQPSEHGQAEI